MTAESDLAFFTLLARKRSFAATALELGVSPPAVSKRLARIENGLGIKLLNRTTRRVSLTGEGEAYLARAEEILRDIEDLNETVGSAGKAPKGLLRVNATLGFGREHIAGVVSEFVEAWPEVEVQLILSDTPLNLVAEGFDISIRFGGLSSSRLIARKLRANRRFMCASPAYLEKFGEPRRLEDLERHNCIVLRQNQETYDVWRFQRNDRTHAVKVHGRLSSNDGEVALNWTLAGHGIMVRSEWDILHHVEAGRLQLVLPRFSQPDADIYAVYAQRDNLSAKVRAFIDFIELRLARPGRMPDTP